MKQTLRADALQVGDILHTSIGKAPIQSIDRTHGGVELVVDLSSEKSTRPAGQGACLWYWPHQVVKVERKKAKRAA